MIIAIIVLAGACAVLLPLLIIAIREANANYAKLTQSQQERNTLKEQVEQYGTDATAQARRIDACLRERDEAIHQCDALQLQLNEALKIPEETAVTPKPKRNSRKKMDAQE